MRRENNLAPEPESVDGYTSIDTGGWAELSEDPPAATAPSGTAGLSPRSALAADRSAPLSGGIMGRVKIDDLISFLVALGCAVFTFSRLHPDLLLTNTTPAGGDMGAHVWGPAFLRDELLPNFRLAGWTPDWYAGFPAYQFYMVVPSLMILLLDLVLPYGIAFKLVTVSGVVVMPIGAWFLGRMARLPFPGPLAMALAATLFLFDKGFTIYGGNIASTLAGEFAFSISLAIALFYLGFVVRGLQTGGHRTTSALLLALVGLCHLIPAFFALLATGVLVLMHAGKGPVKWLFTMGPVAGLVSAFWVLPFALRTSYLNDMGWEKDTKYVESLFPGGLLEVDFLTFPLPLPSQFIWLWVFVFAIGGLVYSFMRNVRLGFFLAVTSLALAGVYILLPQNRLWNARLLPFYYLSMYLLAALGVVGLAEVIKRRWWTYAASGAVTVMTLLAVALPLGALPGATRVDSGWTWAGFRTGETNFVSDWAKWNYEGYERKTAYPEYYATVQTMKALGESNGCGRAMWEYDSDLNQYGTPMALMLLPFWTESCIGSMEGLYFEASATTPYHFLNQSELSKSPSRAQRDLPYRDLDLTNGIQHLQLMGVRYYMARSPEAIDASRAHPDLTQLVQTGPWVVFEVADAALVQALPNLPAVVTDVGMSGHDWLEPSVAFYQDSSRWGTFLAADGPPEWERIVNGQLPSPRPVETAVTISDIREGTDTLSFTVDQVGQPVLVKTSYFPNWKASGAEGPWRVTPNLMVVVPTANEVELSFGRTWVEWVSYLLTILGVVATVVLARSPRLKMGRSTGSVEHLVPPGAVPVAPVADAASPATVRLGAASTAPGSTPETTGLPDVTSDPTASSDTASSDTASVESPAGSAPIGVPAGPGISLGSTLADRPPGPTRPSASRSAAQRVKSPEPDGTASAADAPGAPSQPPLGDFGKTLSFNGASGLGDTDSGSHDGDDRAAVRDPLGRENDEPALTDEDIRQLDS